VDVRFDLPPRVVLDSAWDTLPAAKVAVDGGKPAQARCVSIFRGPVIVAQFRLAYGCDLNWVYSGDHPDLLDTLTSASDVIDAGDWKFESTAAPELTRVTHTSDGVLIEWDFTPHPGWTLKRSALVHPSVPVRVDYTSELIAPSAEDMKTIKSARMCGVRMRTTGFVDYNKAKLFVGGKETIFSDVDGKTLPSKVTLDNGYVRMDVSSGFAAADAAACAAVYAAPEAKDNVQRASCTLTVTGRNQFAGPIIQPKKIAAK